MTNSVPMAGTKGQRHRGRLGRNSLYDTIKKQKAKSGTQREQGIIPFALKQKSEIEYVDYRNS